MPDDSAALDALNGVAAVAQAALNTEPQPHSIEIAYVEDAKDSQLIWRNRTPYVPSIWPPYGEAVSFLCAFDDSSATKMVRTTKMMADYFDFESVPLPKDRLDTQNTRAALAHVEDQIEVMKKQASAVNFSDTATYKRFCMTAKLIAGSIDAITSYLIDLERNVLRTSSNKSLQACDKILIDVDKLFEVFEKNSQVSQASEAIGEVVDCVDALSAILRPIIGGYAITKNNQALPNFFLARLMVIFRITPKESATKSYASVASAQLTAFLNKQPWLSAIMPAMVADLAQKLKVLGTKICFFLKGGRGVKYLLNKPNEGENDWDTQVLIDPRLPPSEWWTIYASVCDIVCDCLTEYNFLFSCALTDNATNLSKAAGEAEKAIENDPKVSKAIFDNVFALVVQASIDEQAFSVDREILQERSTQQAREKVTGNCNAELIDVGIPRYYTVELLEQWDHVRPFVENRTGIPCPSVGYFIDEYIVMLRESEAGVSPSPAKREKRLDRLISIMSTEIDGYDTFLVTQASLLPKGTFEATNKAISAIKSRPAIDLAGLFLSQFFVAYDLELDTNLARVFDGLAASTLDALTIGDAKNKEAVEAIFAWCHAISEDMIGHLDERAKGLQVIDDAIVGLVFDIVGASKDAVKPVADGRYAIRSYVQSYALGIGVPPLRNRSAPAAFAEISLYLDNAVTIDKNNFSALASVIGSFVDQSTIFSRMESNLETSTLSIFASEDAALGRGGLYHPLDILIRIEPGRNYPADITPSIVPLLGLQPLEVRFREQAARTNEWRTKLQLIQTCGVLIEMLARSSGDHAPIKIPDN